MSRECDTPHLSIVIPSHKRADLLRLCLASVMRFAPVRTEVIVVDDGSPGSLVSRAAGEFPGVCVIRRTRPGGFCAAANAGIQAATAPVVELLNDDAEVTEGWARAALDRFADPRVAAVAPLVLQNDSRRRASGLPPLIDSAGDDYDPGGFARKLGHGRRWHTDSGPLTPRPVWGASACAAFYRREPLIRAGAFPEDFRAYFEDVDLSFRLRRIGYEIVHDPGSVVWHRVSSSYGRVPSRRTLEQQSCNEERVFWRNTPGNERLRRFPRHVAVLAAKAMKRFGEGTLLPWFLGRLRALAARQLENSSESSPVSAESYRVAISCPNYENRGVDRI